MSEDKICPVMSRPAIDCIGAKDKESGNSVYSDLCIVYCLKERCMAWEKHTPVDEYDTFEGGWCRLVP